MRKFKIIIILQDLLKADMFHFVTLVAMKDTKQNTIRKLSTEVNSKPNLNLSWSEVIRKLNQKIKSDLVKHDYLITTSTELSNRVKDCYKYDYFNNKFEHRMASTYLGLYRVLSNVFGVVQRLTLENGVILDDAKDTLKYKLEATQIAPLTWAFLFALDVLNRNNFDQLMGIIKDME